jgi:hypothetical protein
MCGIEEMQQGFPAVWFLENTISSPPQVELLNTDVVSLVDALNIALPASCFIHLLQHPILNSTIHFFLSFVQNSCRKEVRGSFSWKTQINHASFGGVIWRWRMWTGLHIQAEVEYLASRTGSKISSWVAGARKNYFVAWMAFSHGRVVVKLFHSFSWRVFLSWTQCAKIFIRTRARPSPWRC